MVAGRDGSNGLRVERRGAEWPWWPAVGGGVLGVGVVGELLSIGGVVGEGEGVKTVGIGEAVWVL